MPIPMPIPMGRGGMPPGIMPPLGGPCVTRLTMAFLAAEEASKHHQDVMRGKGTFDRCTPSARTLGLNCLRPALAQPAGDSLALLGQQHTPEHGRKLEDFGEDDEPDLGAPHIAVRQTTATSTKQRGGVQRCQLLDCRWRKTRRRRQAYTNRPRPTPTPTAHFASFCDFAVCVGEFNVFHVAVHVVLRLVQNASCQHAGLEFDGHDGAFGFVQQHAGDAHPTFAPHGHVCGSV